MIRAICKACKHLFMAPVILGLTRCPKCKSEKTAVAKVR